MIEKFSLYIHEFPNGKRYIGITSKNPEKRWLRGKGYKGNKRKTAYGYKWKYSV